jgi:predicted dehydrogenase
MNEKEDNVMTNLNVGMIGYGFMGKAHSFGYANLPLVYGAQYQVTRKVICGRDADRVREAATQFGWESWETDWRRVVQRSDIDLIDISSPGYTHAEIAIAAAEAGKDIFCEKPLANSLREAQEVLAAVQKAGVKHLIGFNYRLVPAIALAKQFVDEGRLGKICLWRATWLSDWVMPPDFPLVWRLQKDKAGSGALGDIGSHIIDLAHYLVGNIHKVIGDWETFRRQRPLEGDPSRMGQVTVDDGAIFLARFESGAMGTFEATRYAAGNKDRFSFEINGERGSLRFNYNHPGALEYFTWDDPPRDGGFKTIYLGNSAQPYSWWPNVLPAGYGDTFVNEVYELVSALQTGRPPSPGFEAGVRCQAVVEAVIKSIEEKRWVSVSELL